MANKREKTNFNKSQRFNFALTWADVDNRAYRQEIVDLANKIGRTKAGSSREAIPFGPEYYALAPILDEYQAKMAMHLEFRKKLSAEDVAKASGEPYEKVKEALDYIAWAGVAFLNTINGVDMYWQD
ncbi:MAG: pyridine nucleotide-disulfide oxidoreductase, partial [Firmicutes bacterium]|nr:pyridine nucleotide-disulfide oxidoreductase [Bacillota bacterium]